MATTRVRSGLVQVDGLTQLNRALKAMGPETQKKLKLANRTVADFVAGDARSAAASLGGVAAYVAPSIKPVGGVSSAGVAFGGAAYPMAAGAEFGAGRNTRRDRKTGTYLGFNQFDEWTGNGSDAGYFIYPTIRQDADRIETEYTTALDRLLKEVGLA